MNIEFRGTPSLDLLREDVLIEGAVDGRPVRFRFTWDAVRAVAPTVADGRDLPARLAGHAALFAAVVRRKLTASWGEAPAELTVTEGDVLSAGGGKTSGGGPEPADRRPGPVRGDVPQPEGEAVTTYLVAGPQRPIEPCRSEAEAVELARGRAGAMVICRQILGHYVSRQTVWPAVGPVFTEHD
ncbi:MAG TPA: hypothetical protein VF170_00385 [Planctomycetaceae bacterium]